MDAGGRVRRRNQVAFREEGDINSTVSREHARITWDETTGGYWLRAEQNASSTRIYRGGKTIDVSAHDRRGVRLQAGDEIYLGRACVKVGIRTDLAGTPSPSGEPCSACPRSGVPGAFRGFPPGRARLSTGL